MRGWTWAAITVLLFVPGSTAFTATMEFPTAELPPGLEPRSADLILVATCEEVWERTPPVLESQIEVGVAFESPDGTEINGPGTVTLPTDSCTTTEGEVQTSAEYSFSATQDAPGLVPQEVALEATLSGGELGENATDRAEGTVTPGYYGAMQYQVDHPIQRTHPKESATYTVSITNFGNAPTVASFGFSGTGPAAATVTFSDDVTVGSVAHDQDNTATATIVVEPDPEIAPFLTEGIPFTVVVSSHAAEDAGRPGPEHSLSLTLTIEDAKGTPAPTPLLVAPALLGASFLVRRRLS